jgi:conjugal transfer pilus assembly protein TraI
MLKTILRRLRTGIRHDQTARTVYVPPPARHDDTENPRYPPFQEGLPATDPRRLLAPQWEIVRSIQHTLALERADFERLVLPVIERYAAFVHLLPASERHHHRLAGGLGGCDLGWWWPRGRRAPRKVWCSPAVEHHSRERA